MSLIPIHRPSHTGSLFVFLCQHFSGVSLETCIATCHLPKIKINDESLLLLLASPFPEPELVVSPVTSKRTQAKTRKSHLLKTFEFLVFTFLLICVPMYMAWGAQAPAHVCKSKDSLQTLVLFSH